jgi:putative redox protein
MEEGHVPSEIQVQVVWADGTQFVATGLGSQASFVMDVSQESGGTGQGVKPTEALMAALAGCSGVDVLGILLKMRQDVTGLTTNVTGLRAKGLPRPVESAAIEYVVCGREPSEVAVARAMQPSTTSYCGAIASMQAEAKTTYRIEEG